MKNNYTIKGELRLIINRDNKWVYREIKKGYILYKGNFSSWSVELDNLISFLENEPVDDQIIVEYISRIRGNFSLIIDTSSHVIISVDHICSIPLYYLINNKSVVVTDDISYLQKEMGERFSISNSSKLQILMSGYTLFEDTLYTKIKSFIPGQIFLHRCNNVLIHNINNYQAWFGADSSEYKSLELMSSKFNNVILEVMREIINSINNRQIVIPLSGGYDSRLIASILRHYNYENVICFTYGMRDNFEAISAKKIANDLGYKWIFVDLNIKEQADFYQSDDFFSYLEYADVPNAVPYYQGLYSVKCLKEAKLIDNNAVFINGNSGDFITGGHITQLYQYCNKNHLCKNIFDTIINKYYSLWGYMKTPNNISEITKKIDNSYSFLKDSYGADINVCDFIYYYEFINRQSKYVIQGQRVFEYYEYEWRLPLWDSKMIEFWASIPNNYKNEQFLYKSTIEKYNYSNVWNKSDQINKYHISSYLVKYTRRFFKFIVTILTIGNHKIWDRVDRTFFLYFYDITRMLCSVPYWKVVLSLFKYPRHNVSFDAKKYLSDHEKSS